jgi:phospholipase/carboxylesterase
LVDDVLKKEFPQKIFTCWDFHRGLSNPGINRSQATKYGGIIAFTGDSLEISSIRKNYSGDFNNTDIYIGTSDPDPHIPIQRVKDSTKILRDMGAVVTEKIFPGMGHTIVKEEIDWVNDHILLLKCCK